MVAAMFGLAVLAATSSSPVGRGLVGSHVRMILGEEA